jgi:ATP-dependent DNA helicase RecG
VFKEAGLVERYGSGIKRISRALKSEGFPLTIFENFQSGFRVTVFAKRKTLETGSEKDSEKGSGKGSEKGSEKILEIIKKNPAITAKELSNIIGISSRAVEKQIARLKISGHLRRTGGRKTGHWEVL